EPILADGRDADDEVEVAASLGEDDGRHGAERVRHDLAALLRLEGERAEADAEGVLRVVDLEPRAPTVREGLPAARHARRAPLVAREEARPAALLREGVELGVRHELVHEAQALETLALRGRHGVGLARELAPGLLDAARGEDRPGALRVGEERRVRDLESRRLDGRAVEILEAISLEDERRGAGAEPEQAPREVLEHGVAHEARAPGSERPDALVDHVLLEERALDGEHLLGRALEPRLLGARSVGEDERALLVERDAGRQARLRAVAEGGERLLDGAEDDAVADPHLHALELGARERRVHSLERDRDGDGRARMRLAAPRIAAGVLDERADR